MSRHETSYQSRRTFLMRSCLIPTAFSRDDSFACTPTSVTFMMEYAYFHYVYHNLLYIQLTRAFLHTAAIENEGAMSLGLYPRILANESYRL